MDNIDFRRLMECLRMGLSTNRFFCMSKNGEMVCLVGDRQGDGVRIKSPTICNVCRHVSFLLLSSLFSLTPIK